MQWNVHNVVVVLRERGEPRPPRRLGAIADVSDYRIARYEHPNS
jgi:hypothetical protein